jgi:hypothetical protein
VAKEKAAEERKEMNKYTERLLDYLETVIGVGLEEAFDRGISKNPDHTVDSNFGYLFLDKFPNDIVRHIRELHVDIRLREAEHAAENNDSGQALEKIESAIGYLIILHYTLNAKLDPELLEP